MSIVSTSTNATLNTAFVSEIPSFTVPANCVITTDIQSEETETSSPLDYRNPNVAYKAVEVRNTSSGKDELIYEPVVLPAAKYEPHQTLESVVAADEVIVPLTRVEYVKQYRIAEERSAREVLVMCRLVYEANKSLNSADFSDFCNDIGYKDSSSVIRKFIVIGKLQPRLVAYADLLPASWSSIYSLTQIPAQSFENMIQMKRSFKELTVAEVNKLVKETRDLNNVGDIVKPALFTAEEKNDKILGSTVLAKVYFTKMPDDLDWHAFEKALNEVQANLPVRVQFLSAAKEVFDQRKNKRYEKIKAKKAPNPFKPNEWDLGSVVSDMSKTALNDPQEQKAA